MQVRLTERQQRILWATIRHYIATAEPVGSRTLVEEYNLRISPATIRNVMSMLEKAGLLYQPHTSAGRIPSDSGYRIYVDKLITPSSELLQQVEQLLIDRLNPEGWSFEAVLRGAAQILATLSGCITLSTLPQTLTVTIRHLQLVQVEPKRVMLIVVTDAYQTQSALMELPRQPELENSDEIIERELQILSNFLNHHLRGRSLTELTSLNWAELDREFQQYAEFLRTLLADLTRRSQPPISNQILISGLAEVLHQPEFSELQQVQTILHFLEEEQDQLWSLICECSGISDKSTLTQPSPRKRVTVRIGSENPLEPMRTCTLVSSTYQRGLVPVGSVGVLGPTRMAYDKVIALVEATADYLSDALNQPA
jgi:heat-inducible transcriptional repressor